MEFTKLELKLMILVLEEILLSPNLLYLIGEREVLYLYDKIEAMIANKD